jgi:RND family efflux transporter MFP subunit
MKLKNKTIHILGLSLFLALSQAGCSDTKNNVSSNQELVTVQVANSVLPISEGYFSASGQIEAEQFANISTRMMGYVTMVHVKVGDKVVKGQSLIDINDADMEAKKAQTQTGIIKAQVLFNTAKKDLDRFQVLYNQKSASQKELDDIKTRYDIAEAQLENARQMENEVRAMLSYSNIKAPFNGVITSKSVKAGDMANPGQHLLSLEAPDNFVATVMVPETNIPFVHKGANVKVYVKSSEKTLSGTVSEVSTSSQHSGGQYLVKIELNTPEEIRLYSGMFISASFPSSQKGSGQVLLPKHAIVTKGDLQGIYTVSASNTAILRWLKLGRSMGDQIEVLSGLSEGEQYIVSAEGKLYNGAKLNIK